LNKLVAATTLVAIVLLAGQSVPMSMAVTSQVPGPATGLVITIIPPRLPADGGAYPAVIISLVDSTNLPTAAYGNITVFLTSSQSNIASVPDNVTINSGQEYAIANVVTTSTPGSAMITAQSQGLSAPAPAPVTTVTPSGFPAKILVFTSPSVFLPRADSGVVRVEVVDEAGQPSKAINPVPVSLSSSNASIVFLAQTLLTVTPGTVFADGIFHTQSSGQAVISAVSTGYTTGTTLVTVNSPTACLGGCSPNKIALKVIAGGSPGTLPTSGLTYKVLEVDLQSSSGAPTVSSSDTIIQLTSDKSDVASVPGLITIPAGSISSLANVTTSSLTDTATITATAAGLLPATVQIQTLVPAPSKLQAYMAPPSSAYYPHGNYPILVVQLQDNSGNPARARQATNMIVTSSDPTLLSNFIPLSISQGGDYNFSYIHTTGVGTTTLSVASQGLASSPPLQVTSVPSPLVATLQLTSTSNGYIYQNQTATLTFSASIVGEPIKNMNVTFTSSGGTLSVLKGNTGASGTTSTVFTPTSSGSFKITASATSQQSGPINLEYQLTVAQVPQKVPPTLGQQILGYWYYLVAAIAVVVVALVYLFRMRRRKQRAEIEAGFEVV